MATHPQPPAETLHHRVTLAGLVLWSPAEPAAGARVALRPAAATGQAPRSGPTDGETDCKADGSFHFIDLAAGKYSVEAQHQRTEQGRFSAHAALAKVTVTKDHETAAEPPSAPLFVTLSLKPIKPINPPPPRAADARRPPR